MRVALTREILQQHPVYVPEEEIDEPEPVAPSQETQQQRTQRLMSQAREQGYRVLPTTAWVLVDTLTGEPQPTMTSWDEVEQFLTGAPA